MGKVQHFEIPADDLTRAKKFYSEVFGWKLVDVPQADYVMAYTMEVDEKQMPKEPAVINGGLMKRDPSAPAPVIVITVDEMQKALDQVKAEGGSVVMEAREVMGMGLYARVKDTEGNVVGVWQELKKG